MSWKMLISLPHIRGDAKIIQAILSFLKETG